ncbi:hypothetical protein BDV96DRAFT_573503 [Lophiotrema nucula]|uniref:Inner centromere protein ARK-binding domain-containing protein n=1 Tax=Lophiotrema nucula TaxID=690887 RepID=A0A6A5ZA80_9PLEO|nr:hypothetical protein BDV96DRAFT_573503 [Lophiotrema nucula]
MAGKAAIGSLAWVAAERQQAVDLVQQELEDFSYSVRNELEWLNEHMSQILAHNGQTNLEVFKTPGKLRAKTPRTARKLQARQPLGELKSTNAQPSPAAQSLKRALTRAGDENVPIPSPLKPTSFHDTQPTQSTQTTQHTQIFTQEATSQSTQATEPEEEPEERRDTGDSFVSAKEDLLSGRVTPAPALRVPSEQYSISAETHAALDTAAQDDTVIHHEVADTMDVDDDIRSPSDGSSPVKPLVRKSSLTFASLPAREPLLAKKSMGNRVSRTSQLDQLKARNSQMGRFTGGKSLGSSQHAQVHDVVAIDDERPQLQQEVPETTKAAKNSEETQPIHAHDVMDIDDERPELRREESETTKLHNKTSTMRLAERINMLSQKNEPPKRASQSIMSSQQSNSQSQTLPPATQAPQPPQAVQPPQPAYPQLPATQPQADVDDEEDDDWISPIRTAAPAAAPSRPILSKSYSADTRPVVTKETFLQKPIAVSNPDLSTVVESTTPAGSPAGKRYMDGPLSASKAKFYSALRAAKEKIIGSSATSAQVKLDALAEGAMRPKLQTQSSSEDIFTSPKRNDKAGTSIFAQLRSPSKESVKMMKPTKTAIMPGSPTKSAGRRTRSSSEREKQKEREAREKETRQKHRAEERLKEMREKEQNRAAAHYQKTQATAKTPVAAPQQPSVPRPNLAATAKTPASASQQALSRPGAVRMNTGPRTLDPDSGDEMPPPPPPKSLLPTGPGHKLREPKRLAKAPSKQALPKAEPQKIMVNLNGFGRTALGTSKHAPPAPPAPPKELTSAPKPAAPPSKPAPITAKPAPRPVPLAKPNPSGSKPAPRVGRPQPQLQKSFEKPKVAATHPRADINAARPVSRTQTVQDANRINIPPVNPAKPPAKRPFQPENDEPLHRPAKRPSQQAKSLKPAPVTPAHAQFAQGKIPFAESAQPAQPAIQYPNGEDIKLPEIMTDSEDEDSENDFEQPSWANTPEIRAMLERQQLMDPEQIFGPIAPLNMEQVFPNKERHKRFRERTSSAYWANDEVTEEEKRKERDARERLHREKAWTYNPSPAPSNAGR